MIRRDASPAIAAGSAPPRPSGCSGAQASGRARARPARSPELGLDDAVRSLTHPGAEKLVGRPPRDEKGRGLAPADAYGHDHLWWLDRMVRTQPAARRADDARLARLVRDLGQRRRLAEADARPEPALPPLRARQLPLPPPRGHRRSGDADLALGRRQHEGRAERELRARADGALHARRGQRLHRARRARAGPGAHRLPLRLEAEPRPGRTSATTARRHDGGTKIVFGKRGRFDFRDACNLCLDHPAHPRFFVEKLWSYFVPVPPDAATRRALEAIYRDALRGAARARRDPPPPELYLGPRMVKPPVVYTAGLLRALGRRVDTSAWVWLPKAPGSGSSTRRTSPAGTTSAGSTRRRSAAAGRSRTRRSRSSRSSRSGARSRRRCRAPPRGSSRTPSTCSARRGSGPRRTRRSCASRARRCRDANEDWKRDAYPPLVLNAVRQLLAVSPDLQAA